MGFSWAFAVSLQEGRPFVFFFLQFSEIPRLVGKRSSFLLGQFGPIFRGELLGSGNVNDVYPWYIYTPP